MRRGRCGAGRTRFAEARTGDAPQAGDADRLACGQYASRNPAGAALIHNDYKLDNVVFDARQPERLIGVLDWEMATIGDPLMDLGCSLAYWVEAGDGPEMLATRMLPTHLPGSLSRAEVLERYSQQRAASPSAIFASTGYSDCSAWP